MFTYVEIIKAKWSKAETVNQCNQIQMYNFNKYIQYNLKYICNNKVVYHSIIIINFMLLKTTHYRIHSLGFLDGDILSYISFMYISGVYTVQ